jgi:hypothetical protein
LTAEVVSLFAHKEQPAAPERLVWICLCTCTTHILYENGNVECANCGKISDGGSGGDWRKPFVPAPAEPKEPYPEDRKIVHLNSAHRALPKMITDLNLDEIAAVIVIRDRGGVSVWNQQLDSDKRLAWMRERMDVAMACMTKPEAANDPDR